MIGGFLFALMFFDDFSSDIYIDRNLSSVYWDGNGITLPKNLGILDQSFEFWDGNQSTIGAERVMLQSFTPGRGFDYLGRVDVYITRGLNEAGDIDVYIVQFINGKPDFRNPIATSKIKAFTDNFWPEYKWHSAYFPPVKLTPGQKYGIALFSQSPNGCYIWAYSRDYGNGYPAGGRWDSYDSGLSFIGEFSEDFLFKTYSPEVLEFDPGYTFSATYYSKPVDTSYNMIQITNFSYNANIPQGTNINFYFQDSADGVNFSNLKTPDKINSRYFRVVAKLSTNDPTLTPFIDSISVEYIKYPPPQIQKVSGPIPFTGNVYAYIYGTGFANANLYIDGVKVEIAEYTLDTVKFIAPPKPPGNYEVKIENSLTMEYATSTIKYEAFIVDEFINYEFIQMTDSIIENGRLTIKTTDTLTSVDGNITQPFLASAIGADRTMAQSFKTSLEYINEVEVLITRGELNTPDRDIILGIVEIPLEEPYKSQSVTIRNFLATGVIPAFRTPVFPDYEWKKVKFPNPVYLNPNKQYAIVLMCQDSQARNIYYWAYSIGNNYTKGGRYDGAYATIVGPYTNDDFIFKIIQLKTVQVEHSYAESKVMDAGAYSLFSVTASYTGNAEVAVAASTDGINFSNFSLTAEGRYVKYRADLYRNEPKTEIDYVRIDISPLTKTSIDGMVSLTTKENVYIETGTTPAQTSYTTGNIELKLISTIYTLLPDDVYFQEPVEAVFYYPDIDNDGIVDGTVYPETYVKLYKYNDGYWVEVSSQILDTEMNFVKVYLNHFSIYGLFTVPNRVYCWIQPETLNLKSEGNYVSLHLEVLGIKNVYDILPQSVKLEGLEPIKKENGKAKGLLMEYEDSNSNGNPELVLKFSRQKLIEILPLNEEVDLMVEGMFSDGLKFNSYARLKTIKPGNIHPSGARIESSREDLYIVKLKKIENKMINLKGYPYEFGPPGTRFDKPVLIAIPVDEPKPDEDIKIAYYNGAGWEILDSVYDGKYVKAYVNHFSIYQAVAVKKTITKGDGPVPSGVYIYPSPAIKIDPKIHIETPATVTIYDVSGEKLKELEINTPGSYIIDGLNSGVYIAVVNTQNERKILRFGVVK